jgi:4-hydroxy-4-methyl-2-oxoglutarate aldolase
MSDITVEQVTRHALYTAVLGDVLDQMGYVNQFLPAAVRPLNSRMLVGRAMPVRLATATRARGSGFGKLTEALDQLQPGEVYLASGGTIPCAAWGELMTTTARGRGAVGAVLNSYHRDTVRILEHDWPVFSRGAYAQDAAVRSVVVSYRADLDVEGVEVRDGDLVVGDVDGVLIVPRAIESEVVDAAITKMRAEDLVREAILGGMSSSKAFAKHGVL